MAKKTFNPNETLNLKTYKRKGMLHVCLGAYCAGIALSESGFQKEQVGVKINVLPILDAKTAEPRGATVELPGGRRQEWKILDRKTLQPVAFAAAAASVAQQPHVRQ